MENEQEAPAFDTQYEPYDPDAEYERILAGANEAEPDPKEEPPDYKGMFEGLRAEQENMKIELERTRQANQNANTNNHNNQNNYAGTFGGVQPQQKSQAQIFDELVANHGIGGAMAAMYEMAAKQAEEQARKNLFPVAQQTAQYAIEQYRRSANFLSDAHKSEFDKMVSAFTPEQLANADLRNIQSQLELVDDVAYSKATRRGFSTRAATPPTYSGGSGAGGTGSPGKGFVGRKLSAVEKQAMDSAKEYGMSEKDIAEIIRDMRAEGGE